MQTHLGNMVAIQLLHQQPWHKTMRRAGWVIGYTEQKNGMKNLKH